MERLKKFLARNWLVIRTAVIFLAIMGAFALVLEWAPFKSAGVDPYHKLIDRHPDDNEVNVTTGEADAAASVGSGL